MKDIVLVLLFLMANSFNIKQDSRTQYFPKFVENVEKAPEKDKLWVFILAGQSNMAGRGLVEPEDTIADKRILTIDPDGELVFAKEPLHFYEPAMTGLDCGLSFGRTILKHIPRGISVLLIPTAVGGSSISQWLGDSVHRGVKLLSNFREKVTLARKYGDVKAILWHQGESDANRASIPLYEKKLAELFTIFRRDTQHDRLPIIAGELGSYSADKDDWSAINTILGNYAAKDKQVGIVLTGDLADKGDHIHFDSKGQRKLGERYAMSFLKTNNLIQ
jgi:hypothetical protein